MDERKTVVGASTGGDTLINAPAGDNIE